MSYSIREYFTRRFRLALALIMAGGGLIIGGRDTMVGLTIQCVGAALFAGGLLIIVRTRCPRCRSLLPADSALSRAVGFAMRGQTERRCPRCGVDFNEPYDGSVASPRR
jgi:hypothetical protein